jgi:hypothetical protein
MWQQSLLDADDEDDRPLSSLRAVHCEQRHSVRIRLSVGFAEVEIHEPGGEVRCCCMLE